MAIAAPTTTRQITNADTVQPTVPGPPPTPNETRGRRPALIWWAVGSVVAVIAATLIGASLIKVDYVVISPGSTYATNDRVAIGGDQPTYPPSSILDFVTVS